MAIPVLSSGSSGHPWPTFWKRCSTPGTESIWQLMASGRSPEDNANMQTHTQRQTDWQTDRCCHRTWRNQASTDWFVVPKGTMQAAGEERSPMVSSGCKPSNNNDQPGKTRPWVQLWYECYRLTNFFQLDLSPAPQRKCMPCTVNLRTHGWEAPRS